MAIDGANLSGAFPVYDTRGSIGAYNSQLQRQANQRAAEQKALQDDLQKVKIDGLREADKQDYFNGFEQWRSAAQMANQERDLRKKSELKYQADKKFLELQDFISKSKEYGKLHQEISGKFLDDRFRDQFTDDAVVQWQNSGKLPLRDARLIKDPTMLSRQMDLSDIQKKITDVNEDLLKQARYDNPVTRRITSGNKTGTESIYSRRVDPQQQALAYAMMYDTDRDVRAFIRQQYPEQFTAMSPDDAKAFAIQDLVKKTPIQRQDAPKMEWDRAPDNFYAHYNYRLQNPLEGVVPTLGTPQNIFVPFNKGQAQAPANNYIGLSIPKKNFVGAQGVISLDTGKPVPPLQSSSDYEIVGVGNFPIVTQTLSTGKGDIPAGSLSQDTFAKNNPGSVQEKSFVHVQVPAQGQYGKPKDFLVPLDRLPDNIKNSKQVREALVNFKPAQSAQRSSTKQTPQKDSGMVTMILPNGASGRIPKDKVAAFLKKYPQAKRQ